MNVPNGWAYSQHKLQLASVAKGSNGHQMSALANKDPIQLQRASRNIATGSHYMHQQSGHVNCVSDPPANAPEIIYQPWNSHAVCQLKLRFTSLYIAGSFSYTDSHQSKNEAQNWRHIPLSQSFKFVATQGHAGRGVDDKKERVTSAIEFGTSLLIQLSTHLLWSTIVEISVRF